MLTIEHNGLPATTSAATERLTDVGRNRYFLSALQPAATAPAPASPSRGTAQDATRVVGSAPDTGRTATATAGDNTAKGTTSRATASSGAPPDAIPLSHDAHDARDRHAPAGGAFADTRRVEALAMRAYAASRPRLPVALANRWARQKISVLKHGEDIEVLVRNHFLDAAAEAALLADLLAALAAEDVQPARILINGREAWSHSSTPQGHRE